MTDNTYRYMTSHDLAKILQDMPDIPVMATWEGQTVAVSASKITIANFYVPGGMSKCVLLDVDHE